ncbi:MAG: flagellar export protein FliJ [Rubrivivax sp.]
MTSDSIDALQLLLDRATQERDRLASELRRAEEVSLRARRQGQQLMDYRAEYLQRWNRQFGRGGAIEIVQCYQSFMQRLDEAMAQQQRQIEAAERQQETLREALVRAEVRAASVRKLIERQQAERRRLQDRRDQRHTDELAQQAAQRRPRSTLALQH